MSGSYQEINGDLIALAYEGHFDVIVHGCNCFCTMKSGIAPKIAEAFGANHFNMEAEHYKGDINKLGCIDFQTNMFGLTVVNAYTQYKYGSNHPDGVKNPLNYTALRLCMQKINHIFAGKYIGLPKIGAGLAGGDWGKISTIIKEELKDCKVTIVKFENK